ncbi:MAG: DUF2723 domain-containing protein [Ignavibacteria bacterium]|nr:DUF2723 domain-containing protein [Ignavibacteria bacterium]
MNTNKTKLIYQILAFVIPFIAYVITLAPTVTFIDAGELTTVCAKLGVAHPTGYPLFTIIGHLFSLLPTGSVVYSLNLMCAVISSFTIVMFFNLLTFIFVKLKLNDDTWGTSLSENVIYNISFAASLILAFSKTFWDTSNAIEVYSLHTFFIVTNIYLFLKACNVTGEDSKSNLLVREKYWLLFAIVLGLSFGNHLTTIFLSVGFLYLFFAVNGFNKLALQRILLLAIPFIIGLSVYVYLPVRSGNPVLSWGHPDTWDNFYRHVSGKQFSVWMFTGSENMIKQFKYFTSAYPLEFFYIPLIIAILGLVEVFGKSRKLFYYTVLLAGFCVIYAINYDIHDIDSYFLLAYIITAIWIGFGIHFIVRKTADASRKSLSLVLILLALIPVFGSYKLVNESQNYYVKDYTFNVFNSAPQNSIIVSTQWDFWVSASIYFQYVEGIRKDLVIIDKELLRKTWYVPHIKQHYPEIYENSKTEFELYYAELLKFEKYPERYTKPTTEAERQDVMKIQAFFKELLSSLVDKNPNRNFFTTFEVESSKEERFANSYMRVPEGLLIRYIKPTPDYDNYVMPEFKFQITQETDYYHTFLMNAYYNSYMSRANYLMNFSKFDEAEQMINKAAEVKPNGPEIKLLQNKIKQLRAAPKN